MFSRTEPWGAWRSVFLDLGAALGEARYEHARLGRPAELTTRVVTGLMNLFSSLHRVGEEHRRDDHPPVNPHLEKFYFPIDVDYFHVRLIGSMNLLAKLAAALASRPNQVPPSFRKIRDWLQSNPANRDRIGRGLADLFEEASWYDEVRQVRDAIVHGGALTLVFSVADRRPVFQVFKTVVEPIINRPGLMFNEHVVYFDAYAATYLADLLVFLEEVTQPVAAMAGVSLEGHGARLEWPGVGVVASWLAEQIGRCP